MLTLKPLGLTPEPWSHSGALHAHPKAYSRLAIKLCIFILEPFRLTLGHGGSGVVHCKENPIYLFLF